VSATTPLYFQVLKNETALTGSNYYISTPCVKDKNLLLLDEHNILNGINNNDIYFQNLNASGLAVFNLDPGNYSFCLINGQLIYEEDNFTSDYDLISIEKVVSLGEINFGNVSEAYVLQVDQQDLYQTTSPEYWGKTLESVLLFILAIGLGGGLVVLGVYVEAPQLAVVGAVIIMGGLGISVGNIILGALF